MDYFPIFAKLQGEPCLVVGGGVVASRKARQLSRAGARVTVNAPELCPELAALVDDGEISFHAGSFDPGLVASHLLIVAATSDVAVNQEVADVARQARRLCNVVDDGDASAFIMPSVIDRAPIVVAVSSGGKAPMLARMLRQRIEAGLPNRIADLARWAGKWRKTVRDQISSHHARLRIWQDLLDGDAAERVMAGDPAAADAIIAQRISGADETTITGEAWLVGAGPGDPGLITQRGLQLLQRADVVLYDRLIPPSLLDRARRDAELICVGKQADGPSTNQEFINNQLVNLVRQGKRVCRLKGGDPFIFGRGGEEIAALAAAGLNYQVIPGISAANGCAAYAGIPLTHRDLSAAVTLVTAQRAGGKDDLDWSVLAASQHTLVFYMGARRSAHICQSLIDNGMATDTPAALIENGSNFNQRVIGGKLGTIVSHAEVTSPALLIVGGVAALSDQLRWFGADCDDLDYDRQATTDLLVKSNH